MKLGFCLTSQSDAWVDADGRCLAHHERTLPPSTTCLHLRWQNGAWSVCVGEAERGQRKPCKPVAAGTWRSVLDQQERAVAKRDADRKRTARRFSGQGSGPPKLANAHKPAQHKNAHPWAALAQLNEERRCAASGCTNTFRYTTRYPDRRFCSRPCASRAARGFGDRWHSAYDCCTRCGKTDQPPKNKGLCRRCYSADRRALARQKRAAA